MEAALVASENAPGCSANSVPMFAAVLTVFYLPAHPTAPPGGDLDDDNKVTEPENSSVVNK